MKIIRVDSAATEPLKASLMTDSSARPDHRPLFLPDGTWECEIRIAIRIDRLGKAISAKFAPRYYHDYTLVNYLRPAVRDTVDVRYDTMDDAIVLGRWASLSTIPPDYEFNQPEFDKLIEHLSANTTFKTGDIIILPQAIKTYTPSINQQIEFANILSFNIK